MYCSTCGAAVAPGLTYCNYCGEKLNTATADSASKSTEVKPGLLVSSMVALFIFGLVAITLLMGMMKSVLNLNVWVVLAFALLPFLLLLVIEGVLIRQLTGKNRTSEDAVRLNRQTTRELDATQARALPDHIPSVTEHTTRAFDPIYKDRILK